MKKIIKTMPLMALLLGAGIFTVDAAFKAKKVQTDQEWSLNPNGDPTNPSDYTLAPDGTSQECEGTEMVCVIVAPPSGGQPNFDAVENLRDALESGDNHPNIYKAPEPQ